MIPAGLSASTSSGMFADASNTEAAGATNVSSGSRLPTTFTVVVSNVRLRRATVARSVFGPGTIGT